MGDMKHSLVFITGGTGIIGFRVAQRLLDAGYPMVRIGARDFTKVRDLANNGAKAVNFSWDDEETYAEALHGVRSVFCTTPFTKGMLLQFPPFLKACKTAGVKNIVKISFLNSKINGVPFHDIPLVNLHKECDDLLVNSGIPYTVLSATRFMSNPLIFQGKETRRNNRPAMYYGTCTKLGVNYVSPNDVAEVATRVLLDPKHHHRKRYVLTGPELITDESLYQVLADKFKNPVVYIPRPLPSKDIEIICGHRAETFEEYLKSKERMKMKELI